ncbi:MAG: hypothetical protein EZS28_014348, partial [Streblomastix strix]
MATGDRSYLEQAIETVENVRTDILHKFQDIRESDQKSIEYFREFRECAETFMSKAKQQKQIPILHVNIARQMLDEVDNCINTLETIERKFQDELIEEGILTQDLQPTLLADVNV